MGLACPHFDETKSHAGSKLDTRERSSFACDCCVGAEKTAVLMRQGSQAGDRRMCASAILLGACGPSLQYLPHLDFGL